MVFLFIFFSPNVSDLRPPEPKANGGSEGRLVRPLFLASGYAAES